MRLRDSNVLDESGSGLLDLCREASPEDTIEASLGSIARETTQREPSGSDPSQYNVAPRAAASDLALLLAQQAADGSFSQGDIIQRLLADLKQNGIDLRQIAESKLPRQIPPADHATVLITVIAVLLLMINFPKSERSWRRAHRKACRSYLAPRFKLPMSELESWINQISAEVKK